MKRWEQQRLHKTEAAKAYGKVMLQKVAEDEECIGLIWHTQPNCCSDCDDLDGQFFEKGEEIEYPRHPNCLCSLHMAYKSGRKIVGDDSEEEDARDEGEDERSRKSTGDRQIRKSDWKKMKLKAQKEALDRGDEIVAD
jgi:hypothetical protein